MTGKKKSNETLMRQWEMLKRIPARAPGMTTIEISSALESLGYEVTVRTVQRDLNSLSIHFPLMSDEDGPAHSWYWDRNARLDIPNISVADAISIKMVEDYLTPLLPAAILEGLRSRFAQAEQKLESLNDNPLTRWTDRIRTVLPGQPLQSPVIAPGVLETVQTALIHTRQLKAVYRSRNGTPDKEMLLHPLALVQRGPVSYLVATAFEYTDIRLYALHRFGSAVAQQEAALLPDDFDIDAYIRDGGLNFGSGKPLALKLRIDDALKVTLMETPLSHDMVITPDGDRYIVTATVQDTWQLKWWIHSQASQAEALEPSSLREEIKAELQAALAQYN